MLSGVWRGADAPRSCTCRPAPPREPGTLPSASEASIDGIAGGGGGGGGEGTCAGVSQPALAAGALQSLVPAVSWDSGMKTCRATMPLAWGRRPPQRDIAGLQAGPFRALPADGGDCECPAPQAAGSQGRPPLPALLRGAVHRRLTQLSSAAGLATGGQPARAAGRPPPCEPHGSGTVRRTRGRAHHLDPK